MKSVWKKSKWMRTREGDGKRRKIFVLFAKGRETLTIVSNENLGDGELSKSRPSQFFEC